MVLACELATREGLHDKDGFARWYFVGQSLPITDEMLADEDIHMLSERSILMD
jgi:hypothetical protein